MPFRKYDHVERFGTDEVEGIEIGDVLVFPKLDGTNASIWLEKPYVVGCGSRGRHLSDEADNAGFHAWAQKQDNIRQMLTANPTWQVYGEWLVPHTIKHYREEAWRQFWVFDVFCNEQHKYLHYDNYRHTMDFYGLKVIEPKTIYTSPPSTEQLLVEVATNTYLMQDGQIGEGIVIKNYDWKNKYDRQPWAKLVRNEFKEENKRAFGVTEKEGEASVESKIAEKYCTKALVDKILAKIQLETTERKHVIPRLLQTVFHDLVTEDIWHAVKEFNNPKVDFKKLQQYTIYWIKKHQPELF